MLKPLNLYNLPVKSFSNKTNSNGQKAADKAYTLKSSTQFTGGEGASQVAEINKAGIIADKKLDEQADTIVDKLFDSAFSDKFMKAADNFKSNPKETKIPEDFTDILKNLIESPKLTNKVAEKLYNTSVNAINELEASESNKNKEEVQDKIQVYNQLKGWSIQLYDAHKKGNTQKENKVSFRGVGDTVANAVANKYHLIDAAKNLSDMADAGTTVANVATHAGYVADAGNSVFGDIGTAVGAAKATYKLGNALVSTDPKEKEESFQAAKDAGGKAACAFAGGKGGAAYGVLVGSAICPGPGTVIGGAIGAIAGGIGGSALHKPISKAFKESGIGKKVNEWFVRNF